MNLDVSPTWLYEEAVRILSDLTFLERSKCSPSAIKRAIGMMAFFCRESFLGQIKFRNIAPVISRDRWIMSQLDSISAMSLL